MACELSLHSVPKIAPRVSERMVSSSETLSRARHWAAAKGVSRLADITGLDRVGIPVFSAVVPKSEDTITVYNGKGLSPLDARIGALMESIERQTALDANLEIVMGSYAQLRNGRVRAIDPEQFNHRLCDDYKTDNPYGWVHGYDLLASETVLVPAAMSGFGPRFGGSISPFASYFSNGLASGNCMEEAVCHALCELVERDAWTLAELRSHWIPVARHLAKTGSNPPSGITDDCEAYPCIDLTSDGWPINELLEKFAAAGLSPIVRDITSDIGLACVVASAVDDWTPGYPQAHSGLGAHPNARIAVVRALTELAQSRAVDIQGVREDLIPADAVPLEHERHTQRLRKVDQNRWMLNHRGPRRPTADVASVEHDDILCDIRWILSQLRDAGIHSVIAVDLTEPGGMPVVRMVVPEFEFWMLDGGKLGDRALRFWKRHARSS
jgi:ribosomal protein S12 methylthiotransferase accessory factor YcaO